MHLTESQIRRIISELILEGYKDDQRFLQEKYPGHNDALESLPPKWIEWLINQYRDEATRTEIHTFEDAIVTLVKFANRDNSLSTKYRSNEAFRSAVDEIIKPNERGWRDWSDPREALKVTIDQMVTIMGLAERKKTSVDFGENIDIEVDRVGKVGPWNLWMPTSMERSCKIAQYDPITRVPKTTWCTARTSGSNLFYHYVGRPDADIVLFYVIKDNAVGVTDWLSIGYYNGKPDLKGTRGGLSVDRDNNGLTAEKLQNILGSDYDTIMAIFAEKAKEMSGVHPAKEQVRAAARDPELFKKMMKGHSKEENDAMKQMIIDVPDISPEVLNLLADDAESELIYPIARNERTPPEALDKIVDSALKKHNYYTVNTAVENPNMRPETLRMLAGVLPSNFVGAVAKNPNTPADILLDMSRSNNIYALRSLVFNPNLTTEAIENILNYRGPTEIADIHMLLNNPNITSEQVVKMFNMGGQTSDYTLKHPKLPMEFLLDLLDKPISWTTRRAYLNPNVPLETLTRFMEGPDHDAWKAEMLQNPSMPAHILHQWFDTGDKASGFMHYLLRNPNLPEDLMMKIAKKAPADARADLSGNPGVTDAILQMLAKDRATRVRDLANIMIRRRQREAVNEAVMRVIRRLVR
jgi:hypothetical protein